MDSHQNLIVQGLIVLVALAGVLNGQFNMPCTTSMLTSFTPCMNFITNSSPNGTSPTAQCCNVIKSFMANGTDCMCLIVTGSPFQIPINRTLALSLPSACNMPAGVPLQCKASGAPIPAPGPIANGPAMSPTAAASPEGSLPVTPSMGPAAGGEDETPVPTLTPPSPTTVNTGGSPPSTTNTGGGNRQAVNPSAASTHSFSPLLILLLLGAGSSAIINI